MVLRGSSLRNCEWIYGIAIYTGHDTKVMMNSSKSRPKKSKIERATNKYIFISIFVQIVVCLFSAIYTSVWQSREKTIQNVYYLELWRLYQNNENNKPEFVEVLRLIFENFGKWFLIMMNFVSISLLVSLEMVKFAQGIFIEKDWMLYDEEKDLPAKV